MRAERIVVTAGGRERRSDALADGVQVDAMQSWREPVDVDVQVQTAGRILGELRPADGRSTAVDDRGVRVRRATGSNASDRPQKGRHGHDRKSEADWPPRKPGHDPIHIASSGITYRDIYANRHAVSRP